MTRYITRRLLLTIPVLLLVSMVVFTLIALIPGDPALVFAGGEADPEAIEALRRHLGLDRPLVVRYAIWLGHVLRGDLGKSVRDGRPVREVLLLKLPVTVELAVLSLVVSWAIAVPAGVLAAWKRRSVLDYAATTVALAGISIPNFWLGIMLIYLLAVNLRWLPPSGYVEPWIDPARNLQMMVMPATVLGTALAALVMRLLRSSMLEVLGTEYIRTAQAKGLRDRVVLVRHALKNAMIPVATVMGLQLGGLLGGAVITETIFAVPGIGRLAVESILTRDYPMVQGVVLFSAVAIVFVNFAVDVSYSFLDPRIRLVEERR
ncbi:MAG: ABC transporter permease [Armatimonadota bacterium]|nr:ABC transporter permease [Armatimonadota bacterium]MDR7421613.1 ABC transporter permease [Armatimonadota bacterium]MDR7454583.1 ABC transporter permease [Armatimonadota bacterium]MDR7456023.1 ABC transporter permease [Armatimonadota bacterium]MDR7495940.1 ABC transporter permease [Armatimonadota bacterium]